jgi:hypothetical protein
VRRTVTVFGDRFPVGLSIENNLSMHGIFLTIRGRTDREDLGEKKKTGARKPWVK